jgi:FAD:protein FMN transferase
MMTPDGMQRLTFAAMGTTITIVLPIDAPPNAVQHIQALFHEWESQLSRFDPSSELSYVNAHAGSAIIVSPLFVHVLDMALQAAHATGGIYDPTLLPHIIQAGYDRTFNDVAKEQPSRDIKGIPTGAWRAITLDREQGHLYLPAGAALDFGGIAKGMAVDAAIDELRAMEVNSAMVNAGGDLALLGLPINQPAWSIAIDALQKEQSVALQHGALATSGIAKRHWRQGRKIQHHLIDPRTGLPATTDLWSVSVAAATCMQAEIAAKVAFILGTDEGRAFLQAHNLSGLLQQANGSNIPVGVWPINA